MFYKLKDHLTSLLAVQKDNVFQMALDHPESLCRDPQFFACKSKIEFLVDILDEAERIEGTASL